MKEEEPKKAPSPPPRNLKIEVGDDVAQGMYTNLTMINHNESEFILDYIFVQPTQPKAKVRARIIMSPKHARRFLAAFERNFAMYEKKFGRVPPGPAGPSAPPTPSDGGEVVH